MTIGKRRLFRLPLATTLLTGSFRATEGWLLVSHCERSLSLSPTRFFMMTASEQLQSSLSTSPPEKSAADPRKSHCTTVCAVPPPSATVAWSALTRARRELRDPGFYRWPPHANLLYPFLELRSMKKRKGRVGDEDEEPLFDQDMLHSLSSAAARCQPFQVTIDRFGTFGGAGRGVLWAYPRSHTLRDDHTANNSSKVGEDDDAFCNPSEPMILLQSYLEQEFPTCTEQRKQRSFHPHITLSHYGSVDEASKAMKHVTGWWEPITYEQSEVYVLRRVGDEGQFEIAATIQLGKEEDAISVHDPPICFPAMPDVEEDWVREERMKLKARRNRSWKSRNRRRGGRKKRNGRSIERVPDTPEIIEAKRAARKAKREAHEREAQYLAGKERADTS